MGGMVRNEFFSFLQVPIWMDLPKSGDWEIPAQPFYPSPSALDCAVARISSEPVMANGDSWLKGVRDRVYQFRGTQAGEIP